MKLTSKTRWLALTALVLVALNLLFGGAGADRSERPVLPGVRSDAVTRIELSGAEDKVVLEPRGDRWQVTGPYQADADQEAVKAVLAAFRKDIPVDVQIDQGNEDKYGLEPGKGYVVELWTEGTDPVISFTVGDDAAGGSSYIRLSGGEAIYRARVGGRGRFARAPAEWRNRMVLDLAPERVLRLSFRSGGSELTVSRAAGEADASGPAVPGPWSLEPAPPWPLDQGFLSALTARLARLEATTILPAETPLGSPAGDVQLGLDDDSQRELHLFRDEGGRVLATVDEGTERYRVASSLPDLLPKAVEDLRDRTVLSLDRGDLDTLSYEDASGQVLLRQDATSQVWQLIQPADLQLDVRQVQVAVNLLAGLRAEAVLEGAAGSTPGLAKPAARIVATRVDGSTVTLEIGAATTNAAGRPAWLVRRAGGADAYVVADELIKRIRAGFGRS